MFLFTAGPFFFLPVCCIKRQGVTLHMWGHSNNTNINSTYPTLLFPFLCLRKTQWLNYIDVFFNGSPFSLFFRLPTATSSCLMCWVGGGTSTSMSLSIQSECSTHTLTHDDTHDLAKWAECTRLYLAVRIHQQQIICPLRSYLTVMNNACYVSLELYMNCLEWTCKYTIMPTQNSLYPCTLNWLKHLLVLPQVTTL